MITILSTKEVKQGSEKWLTLRSQYVSATDAYSLLKGRTINEILKSKLFSNSFSGNYWTERGHLLEPEAKEIYSEIYQPTYDVGFIINDKFQYVGCSPDGLVGDDGMVEVKCFGEKHHLSAHEKTDPSIVAQIQYQLWVSERKWNDLVLYNPEVEDIDQTFFVKRFYPDKETHKQFEEIFRDYENHK